MSEWIEEKREDRPSAFEHVPGFLRRLNLFGPGRDPKTAAAAPAPDPLHDKLVGCRLLEGVDEAAIALLAEGACWFNLPGGCSLDRDDEEEPAMYLVLAGALGVIVKNEIHVDTLVATIPAGESVGEMSLISGEAHSAQLVAVRDSELLRIPKSLFETLTERFPRVLLNTTRQVIRRLRDTTRRVTTRHNPRAFALVPLRPGIDLKAITEPLIRSLASANIIAGRIPVSAQDEDAEWFHGQESSHDLVLFEADGPGTPWAQQCMRQADRLIYVGLASDVCDPSAIVQASGRTFTQQKPDLVILHEDGAIRPGSGEAFTRSSTFSLHHHIRTGVEGDIKRLARFLSGRAVAVVLAGGGARGFAHIGVLEALKEMRVPFDFIGGSSMGSIVAAGIAAEYQLEELTDRLKKAFVDSNPLTDYTLPLVSIVRGRKVVATLKEHFGERAIEDLPRNFFCVSSNLTTGSTQTHRSGPLWRALRASVSIPGILPPVIDDGELLVDGGLMNNFPVDVMSGLARGPIIGIDVTGAPNLVAHSDISESSVWELIKQGMRGVPSIVSILMRSGTVGNETQRRHARAIADLLFDPPMDNVGLQTWKSFDVAIEAGYRHAVEVIEAHGLPPAIRAACA